MTKFLTAVSALALGLAMSSAAMADDVNHNEDSGVTQANDNFSNNDLLSNNQDNDQANNNQDNDQANNNTVASHNDTDISDINNDKSDNSTNTTVGDVTVPVNSGNDSSNHDNGNDRNNNKSINTAVVGNKLLSDNNTEVASRNTISVDNSVDINVEDNAIGIQSLSANVTDVGLNQGSLGLLSLASNGVDTGDNDTGSNAFSGLTGIATVSQDTGVASIGQAATQVNANASLNFQ